MPPAALVSIENTKKDPMLAPKYRERVEYIVISGKEGSRVKDLVVSPADYIKKHNYKLNSRYYIENVINNALNRIFEAFKIDIQVIWLNNH
jgi:DNA polymerase elongation subunit (family B)